MACAKHKVGINRNLYAEGYKKGVKTYCNPQAVFEYALHGQGDYKSCPLKMQNGLRPYYNVANNFYLANKNLKSLEDTITTAKTKIYDSDLKEETRKYYRECYSEASNKLNQAQREYNITERDLENFKRNAKFNDY